MHQPSMSVGTEQRRASNGGSAKWTEMVGKKIQQEAGDLTSVHKPSIPTYYRSRFDALGNEDYPSIFKANHRAAAAVAMPPMAMAMPMLSHTDAPPPPTQQTQYHIHTVAVPAASRQPVQSKGGRVIVAAVGPYHHHHHPSDTATAYAQPHPPLITHVKKRDIVRFITGGRFDTAGFLEWARDQEAMVRSCYERDSFTMDSEKLAEMLLLDGCLLLFAVFLLRASVRDDQRPSRLTRDARQAEDFTYLSADILLHMKQTRLDMLMLGNQIPFFVLTELHDRLRENTSFFQGIEPSLEKLALSCFDGIHPPPTRFIKPEETPKVHHLLHLFHWSRVPRDKHKLNDLSSLLAEPESHLPCATWLDESQTSFSKRAAPGSSSSSLHIAFRTRMLGAHGVMHVPAMHIHDYSESVFRSLIAFEQNHLRCGIAVTAYSICMARLLQTEADAKLLRESGILAHTHKTDKEIVGLFNGLADECSDTFYSGDLLGLYKDVTAHHQSTAARAVKWVGLRCFPRQSVTFFVIFGALISIATLINTSYSVYRFYHSLK